MKTLSIATPTRNRPLALEQNIRGMLPELRKYNIPLFIRDDSTNDETEHMIAKLKEEYPLIDYKRNTPPKGHDCNCLQTIQLPSSDYVWYLGDSAIALEGTVTEIYERIQLGSSFVFLNRQIPRLHLGYTGNIPDFDAFIEKNLWHITLTSATVYSKEAIKDGIEGLNLKDCANFAQLGIIMNAYNKGHRDGIWIQRRTMVANRAGTKSYWAAKTVPIFATDWATLVRAYCKNLSEERVNKIIRSHSKHTGILGFWKLLQLRIHGVYTKQIMEENWDNLVIASPLPKFLLKMLAK